MKHLEGKIAVISGGTSGIGLATAQKFVAEGAHVVIFGRRQSALDEAAGVIGKNVTAIQADAGELADLDRVVDEIRSTHGHVDIVVSNAGLVEPVLMEQVTPDHFDRTFDLNARGAFFFVQKCIPLLRTGGSIVLVSSAMHLKGIPGHSTYAASKAVLRSYVRTWAAEFKDRGIRANLLSPGVIDTPILDSQASTPEARESLVNMYLNIIPMGRLGRPEEIAHAALFLASDMSSYMTGGDLMVDGGVGQV